MEPASPRPLALVTGASTGIGRALARQFAAHGFDLVLAAHEPEVAAAASALERQGAAAEPVQVDLATPEGVVHLHERVAARGRPLDVLALNAGIGTSGAFADVPMEEDLRVIDLDVRSTVHLAKLALPAMVARGRGRVLVTSSIAATMPGPYQATYNASKAFVQSFALALRNELKDSGVTVTSLMPGPTDTPFFDRADMRDTRIGAGRKDDPDEVAEQAYEGLMEGRERVVAASALTKLQNAGSSLLPDALTAELVARMAKPGSAT